MANGSSSNSVLVVDTSSSPDFSLSPSPLASPNISSSGDVANIVDATNPLNVVNPLEVNSIHVTESSKKRKCGTAGRVYSEVWKHFDKTTVNGVEKAKCKYCFILMAGEPSKGTSHLKNHYMICMRNKQKVDIRQQVLQTNFHKGKFDISSYSFDQDMSRSDLAKMIIVHEYPLTMVEHEKFRIFCNNLNPLFKVVSRNTIKSDCLKIYEQEKLETMTILEKNESRIAVTTDMWTSSHQKKGFMVVTAHFVDNLWNLQSRIISFVYVPCPHTSEVLCDTLLQCLLDWNIDRKLSTVTVDNCSTNDSMIEMLMEKLPTESLLVNADVLHMRCCAHILNLVVKEGLLAIEDAIEKIRDSVAYWSRTQKRVEFFEETARQLRISMGKKLIVDCKTRWNSTYLMLQTAYDYKDVFFRLRQRESKYKCVPSELDWSMTKEICARLKVFSKATELFFGTKYPIVNIYFSKICEIRIALGQWVVCGNSVVEAMASKMLTKFDKYWSIVHGIMGVSTILDPRYKMVLLRHYFGKIYGSEAEFEVEKVILLCRSLVDQYVTKEYMEGDLYMASQVTSMETDNADEPEDIEEIMALASSKRKSCRSELDSYLDEKLLARTLDFDILSWWKLNKGSYPILNQIAKDILAIPVSTVASESAFSTSGRILNPHRSSLQPKTVEALMCAQNWLIVNGKGKIDPLKGVAHAFATVFHDSDEDNNED